MKKIALTPQSMITAIQTPNKPKPNWLPKTKLKQYLNIHMEAIEMIIVYLASLAARRALGRVKLKGHIVKAKIAWS